MMREYIKKNFGNVHLIGFEYLVKACELYEFNSNIVSIYKTIGAEVDKKWTAVERDIRYYIHNIAKEASFVELIGVAPISAKNKKVIAIIADEVKGLKNSNKRYGKE